jgi:ferrochelatase
MITLEGLVNLIDGELLNSPFISQINGYSSRAKDIKRGSLFICLNEKDIDLAIKKGAYGILIDKYVNVTDEEIAWIKVDNIEKALCKIVKYESLNSKLYFVDEITLDIIKSISKDKEVLTLKGNTIEQTTSILNNLDKEMFSSNEEIKSSFVNVEELKSMDIKILKESLFKTEIVFDSVAYDINLPAVYINEFSKAINFFILNNYSYSLNDIKISRFTINFVSTELNLMDYGSTNQVIITGLKNDEKFFDELNFIIKNGHSNILFINKNNLELLQKENFNFAFLVDVNFEITKKERTIEKLF